MIQDAAPDLYEACVKMARRGHTDTCDTRLIEDADITDCTCVKRRTYARGDDPLKVDSNETYEV